MNAYEQTREKLEQIAKLMDRILVRTELDDEIHRIALEAQNMADDVLSLSPRNCDVGTAEEQAQRFELFCCQAYCSKKCPLYGKPNIGGECGCAIEWAQMPYKEGGKK